MKNTSNFIADIPKLKWGHWADCSYGACVTQALRSAGKDVTYEEVMGKSGMCFRLTMHENCDPSLPMAQNAFGFERLISQSFGRSLPSYPAEKMRQKIVESIDQKIPVLCCGQRAEPEWGLITGYESDGEVLFGRTFFDEDGVPPENEVFTDYHYYLADRYPGYIIQFFNQSGPQLSEYDILMSSLRSCIEQLHTGQNEFGVKRGYEAYDQFVETLKSLDPATVTDGFAACFGYLINSHRDARRCAYIYLGNSQELVKGDKHEQMIHLTDLYREIFDCLQSYNPYQEGKGAFYGSATIYNAEGIQKMIDIYTQCKRLEEEAESVIVKILN